MNPELNHIPVQTLHLFPKLDKMLIDLLQSLSDDEWNTQTVAKLWTVKDVVSHLFDGNLRGLSYSRDKYFGEKPPVINSYSDLVNFINQQNLAWTSVSKKLSPRVLMELLETTGKEYSEHLATLNPFDDAIFSVAWAGQDTSPNWLHIAREYTEKFIHQQQIREAVGKQALFTKDLFFPFIDTFMYAFPHTYRNVIAEENTKITIKILTEIGGEWSIFRTNKNWEFTQNDDIQPTARVSISPDIAWKLFSKSIKSEEVLDKVVIEGNQELGEIALTMVSVMA